MLRLAAEIAGEARCPGHRADILLLETARALAAWEGLSETTSHHLREAAGFVLPHRMMGALENPEVSTGEPSGDQAREQMENSAPPIVRVNQAVPNPTTLGKKIRIAGSKAAKLANLNTHPRPYIQATTSPNPITATL